MGATTMCETVAGSTPDEAYRGLLQRFRDWNYTDAESGGYDGPQSWPDLFVKGWQQAWDKPVPACAVEWMRGWVFGHAPAGLDPGDKWGPWLAFPLETGEWHFFGWVNT